jgi:N-methylhydantoinase A
VNSNHPSVGYSRHGSGENAMSWTVGVDVGGTFTDFCAVNEGSGAIRFWKRPSTPDNPAVAILDGIQEMTAVHKIEVSEITRLAHGTTVATNTLIQRKGRPVALITTRGFRDLVEIGRQIRPHVYDLQVDAPEPLVPRQRRFEVTERITSSGTILKAIDWKDVDAVVEAIRNSQVEAIAVCFLFSFLNPEHERKVAERLRREFPGIEISISAEVQPEFREYERFNTTIINAYLQPALKRYFEVLEENVFRVLPRTIVGINQSSGGLMTINRARALPVRTALSEPAAGVMGALHVTSTIHRENAISIDVGGTSADVALIRGGRIETCSGREVDGFPIRLPMVDIETIGAGGGSIAWFDRDGLLKMGPMSAGARPGPACYGLGGQQATLSDANLILGRLSAHLLDGAMQLDIGMARRAIEPIATRLGKSIEATAHGMVAISVANMVRAIRIMSIERGHDPRMHVLIPFGGAGPLHAHDIAEALSISEIIVPRAPGIMCAQGLVISDLKEDLIVGIRVVLDGMLPRDVQNTVVELVHRAQTWARTENIRIDSLVYELSFDMRYVGQNFELSVPVFTGQSPPDRSFCAQQLRSQFFNAHERAYGFHDPDARVEIVNARLTVRSPLFRANELRSSQAEGRLRVSSERDVWFSPLEPMRTKVYKRDELPLGAELLGPAIIEQLDTTMPLFPGDRLQVDRSGNLFIETQL